jgi:large subunit ribosomal protein L28
MRRLAPSITPGDCSEKSFVRTVAKLHTPMSKVCAVCGKAPAFGHNRSHSMVATKRRFNPNLQRVRILVNGVPRRSYVCARCLKSGKVEKAL